MVRDSREHVPQVAFGVQIVEFRGAEETIDCRGALPAIIGSSQEPVLAAQGNGAERSLRDVIVDLEPTVVPVAGQSGPARERVADRHGQAALSR